MCIVFVLRDRKSIEFRDTNNLSQILYTHSLPHKPGLLCTVDSFTLLYQDRSEKSCEIHWLDCYGAKPKLIKEKSFTTSLQYIRFMIAVQNGDDELIIVVNSTGIQCYSTCTKNLKWSVEGKLPGMKKALYAVGLTSNPQRGHLFVSDGWDGNNCIHLFSVSDGQYLGCLIKEGEQGLGLPHRICWHSASHSLAVAHWKSGPGSLSMIDVEY